MRRRIALGLGALCATALVAAGCGGEDDDGPPAIAEPQAGESDRDRLVIQADEGAFNAHAVYERVAPGVVTITSVFPGGDNPLGGSGPQAGQGSGFVISEDGGIVTNAHVVTDGEASGSDEINAARSVFVQFPDRSKVEAEVIGFDPFADVGLVKVDPEGLDLQPVELGSLDEVEVGDPVAAIGSPFDQRQSLSVGVVSATDRSIPSLTQFRIDGAIQTDASINPGNSGGPLLDAEGRVIGINQQIDTTSGGNQGVGFAVPVDLAQRSIRQLREDGSVDYAFIGVESQPLYPQLAERLGLDVATGSLIASVVPDGPADEAGLCCTYSDAEQEENSIRFQAQQVTTGGDVIVSVEGEKLVEEADLPRIISRLEPGQDITLEIIRDGERMDVDATLGTRPTTGDEEQ